MSLRHKILMLVASVGLIAPQGGWCSEDFDTEVEESMAEMDATSAQAKVMRARQEKEEAEAERQKKEAQKMKAAADARHKQTEAELVSLEKDIKSSRAEQAQAKKEKAAAEKQIARDEAKLKEGMAFLAKLRAENEALRKLRDEQIAKIEAVNMKTKDTQAGAAREQLALDTGKKEFEKGKLDLKAAQERLVKAEAENNKKKAELIAQLEQLKAQHKANKDKTDVTEKEILDKRRTLSKKEEEVKMAETEVQAGEGRMKDAEDRLKELSERAKGKEGELHRREQEAAKHLESREAKEALLAVKSAQAGATLAGTRTVNGEQNMKVEMRGPASVSPKMTMSKECGVYEKPDGKSKMLGKKKAGTVVSGRLSGDFVGFSLRDGRTVFIPKNCF